MMNVKSFLFVAALGFVAGCSNPADNVSAAKVGESSTPANATAEVPKQQLKRFVFNGETSKIEFIGSKVTGSHNGGFKKFEGEIHVSADGTLAPSGNKVTIDTASLWSDNNRLTGHLKNPDFFDVEKYPISTFVSTAISQQGTNSTVTGDLTMHGVTKQITFPAAVEVTDQSVALRAEFSINRFDFEMKYSGQADNLIRKEVVLKLDIKAAPAPTQVASH